MSSALYRGARVKLNPMTMPALEFNETYGEVISLGRLWIYVRGEHSGRTMMFQKSSMNGDYPPLERIDEPRCIAEGDSTK